MTFAVLFAAATAKSIRERALRVRAILPLPVRKTKKTAEVEQDAGRRTSHCAATADSIFSTRSCEEKESGVVHKRETRPLTVPNRDVDVESDRATVLNDERPTQTVVVMRAGQIKEAFHGARASQM